MRRYIWTNRSYSTSLFVANLSEILIAHYWPNNQVARWSLQTNASINPSLSFSAECSGLFVDLYGSVYCSRKLEHQVVKQPLINPTNTFEIVAGTGCPGVDSTQLWSPQGIFVSSMLDLYVADCENHRIQLFRYGQLNATSVAGRNSNSNISLNCPTAVTHDADGYLFIVDSYNNRIIGSDRDGFRCLVGCASTAGSSPHQLNNPTALYFDSIGNMLVLDRANHRIQKFFLATNPCSKYRDCLRRHILEMMTGSRA